MDTVSLQPDLDSIAIVVRIQSTLKFNASKSVHLHFSLKLLPHSGYWMFQLSQMQHIKILVSFYQSTCLGITTINILQVKPIECLDYFVRLMSLSLSANKLIYMSLVRSQPYLRITYIETIFIQRYQVYQTNAM